MNWKQIIAIVAGLAIIVLIVFTLQRNKEISRNKVYQYDKEQAIHVQADTLVPGLIKGEDPYSGTFEPSRESKLSTEQPGKIEVIYTEEGAQVSKGQKLVQIDNTLLQQQLQTIDVQIQNAKTAYSVQLNANQIQIDALEKDVQRYTVLAQADAIKGVQLEQVEQQLATAKNQRVALLHQANLKTAEAQRKSVVAQINKTAVYAPFSGIITAKLAEVGSFAAPGMPLVQITAIKQLKLTVNVNEDELHKFVLHKTYPIAADAYPEITLQGKTTMIGSKANMGSSFPVQFTVSNTPDLKIKSGMFGKVFLQNTITKKGITIPSSAIRGTTRQPQVYLVQNGKAVLQDIDVAQRIGNKAIISKGLKTGDVLITNGFINLFENAHVIIK